MIKDVVWNLMKFCGVVFTIFIKIYDLIFVEFEVNIYVIYKLIVLKVFIF